MKKKVDPQMRRMSNNADSAKIDLLFKEKGITHLQVQGRGDHLVIYSQEEEEKFNRARLTRKSSNKFLLSMANHRGKWEPTPYTGSIDELVALLTEQFGFAIADY